MEYGSRSLEGCIGSTPLIRLENIERSKNLHVRLLAKAECFQPGGSVKDRTAKALLESGVRRGMLRPGGTVVEATSGGLGISLAMLGAERGYRCIIVMPENMSPERQMLLRAYGAQVVLTPAEQGMDGAVRKAKQLASEIPGSFLPEQFSNPANAAVHRAFTGPEIWKDAQGRVDIFVAGVGTGGTITGVGEYLKSKNAAIRVVVVEPMGSAVLSGGKKGGHSIAGIGAGFVPEILNREVIDEVIPVSDEDAFDCTRLLAKKQGIFAGISSGAAVYAALLLASREENRGKTVVTLLPDTGSRYLSVEGLW